MPFQGLKDHTLDFQNRFPQELLTRNGQQVTVRHNLHLISVK